MMSTPRELLVTCALPYANNPLHLGHLLEQIQADIWVRYQRLEGHRVHFICADDTHGTAITLQAQKEGITEEVLLQNTLRHHRRESEAFGISFDLYHSTHCSTHRALVEQIFLALQKRGVILRAAVKQLYDEEKQMFLADRFVKGRCPRCQSPDQYGDNCDACGATYSPEMLIGATSVLSGTPPVFKESEHLFLDLPLFTDMLHHWAEKSALEPCVVKKLEEWFTVGLKRWDISREAPYFGWTIPGETGKYFYVWLDAPIGYMSTFKILCAQKNLNFDAFWGPDATAELYHFIGKDIAYFHTLFWPAMLEGSGHRLPSSVFVHGHVTVNGTKMSKSKGTFIQGQDYLKHCPAEALRYYFATKLSHTIEDLDFDLEDFIQRVNSDIVNKVVNIAARCAPFIEARGGRLAPALHDPAFFERFTSCWDSIVHCYERRAFYQVTAQLMTLANEANHYINAQAPWHLDDDALILAVCTQALNCFRVLMIAIQPIMPSLAASAAAFLQCDLDWGSPQPLLNHPIRPFKPLFLRIEHGAIAALASTPKTS